MIVALVLCGLVVIISPLALAVENLNTGFGVIFFREEIKSPRKALINQVEVIPNDFGTDVKEATGRIYAFPGRELDHPIRTVVQTYDRRLSYESLKQKISSSFPQRLRVSRLTEYGEGKSKYLCHVKVSEGERCYWVSGDNFIFVLVEMSQDSIKNISGLENSWKAMLQTYLTVYPPTSLNNFPEVFKQGNFATTTKIDKIDDKTENKPSLWLMVKQAFSSLLKIFGI